MYVNMCVCVGAVKFSVTDVERTSSAMEDGLTSKSLLKPRMGASLSS